MTKTLKGFTVETYSVGKIFFLEGWYTRKELEEALKSLALMNAASRVSMKQITEKQK